MKSLFKRFIILSVFIFFVFTFVMQPVQIVGDSMSLFLNNHDLVFVNKVVFSLESIQRFDIVVIDNKKTKNQIIKRVIGLQGEYIEYKDDVLYINGHIVEEDFLDIDFVKEMKMIYNSRCFTDDFVYQVQDDEIFVLGDNRKKSQDSRVYGGFRLNDIVGVNGFVYYPISRFKFLN